MTRLYIVDAPRDYPERYVRPIPAEGRIIDAVPSSHGAPALVPPLPDTGARKSGIPSRDELINLYDSFVDQQRIADASKIANREVIRQRVTLFCVAVSVFSVLYFGWEFLR